MEQACLKHTDAHRRTGEGRAVAEVHATTLTMPSEDGRFSAGGSAGATLFLKGKTIEICGNK